MKKIKSLNVLSIFLFIGLSVYCLSSCRKDDDGTPDILDLPVDTSAEDPYLFIEDFDGTIAPSEIKLPPSDTTIKFAISSSRNWQVYLKGDTTGWISVVPDKGKKAGEVTISIKKNSKVKYKRTVTLSFKAEGLGSTQKLKVIQNGPEPILKVVRKENKAIIRKGEDIVFTMKANTDWEYEAPDWLELKTKTDTSLLLTATENSGEPREATISFHLSKYESVKQYEKLVQLGAPGVLDVKFNLDGTAKDISPMQNVVIWNKSVQYPLKVSFNETYQQNMVTFSPESNNGSLGAYYRVDIGDDFYNKLADSHSFVCLIKFDVDYSTPQKYETKFLSCHGGGGTGLMVSRYSESSGPNGLTFLPNTGGAYHWSNSKIKPDGKSWYYLVGVWNKELGQAFIYVNGELKGTASAPGDYDRPSSSSRWMGIGGDAGGTIQGEFQGSMIKAQIYDEPLTEDEVKAMWNQLEANSE